MIGRLARYASALAMWALAAAWTWRGMVAPSLGLDGCIATADLILLTLIGAALSMGAPTLKELGGSVLAIFRR